jgi:nucleotide-binding universal stress UspA family protein
MPGSIVCGVDGSESARGAARVARGLSSKLGLGLVFVRVLEDGPPAAPVDATARRLQHLANGAGWADRGSDRGADRGAGWIVEHGHPADRLVAVAEETEAALIVVGSHGPRSSSLGSISLDVSKRAPCPVVVVPPGADTGFERADVAGGIARFDLGESGLGGGAAEPVGGILRFGLGSRGAD